MPHRIKSAPERYTGLGPASLAERRTLAKVTVLTVCVIALVAGLWVLQVHWQRVRELTWSSARGEILDVRPVLAGDVGQTRGGTMVYRIEVLAKYTFNNAQHERWISMSQAPRSLDDARIEAFRWRGRPCIVRWNPSNPVEIVVEIS